MRAIAAALPRPCAAAPEWRSWRFRVLYVRHEAIGDLTMATGVIRAGDADAAQHVVRTNWRNATERLAAVIERAGERGAW